MQFTPNCFSHADPVIKVTKFSRLHLFWNYLIFLEVMNLIIPGLILCVCVCVGVFCLSVSVFHHKTSKLYHQSLSWFRGLNSLRSWSTKSVEQEGSGSHSGGGRELMCCIISENVLVFTLTGASVLLKYLGTGSASICWRSLPQVGMCSSTCSTRPPRASWLDVFLREWTVILRVNEPFLKLLK